LEASILAPIEIDAAEVVAAVSTGRLPTAATVARLVGDAHDRYKTLDGGTVADDIPSLARSDCPVSGRRSFAGALALLVPRWASERLRRSLCTGRRRAR
jgi:hypothetical protein